MTTKRKQPSVRALRDRAEARLAVKRKAPKVKHRRAAVREPAGIEHELEVHKVELEIQNEELRAARDNAEAALELYTEVFDFAPIGYVTLTPTREVVAINHTASRLIAMDRERAIGARFTDHVCAGSRGAFENMLARAFEEAAPVHADMQLQRGHATVPVRAGATALRRGRELFLVSFEDVSEHAAREAELSRAHNALNELNRRKDEFIAVLSHELRNPLTPIHTSIEALADGNLDRASVAQAVRIIERGAKQLSRLVDDLLDVTRIAHGKIELEREEIDFCEVVRDKVEDRRASIQAHGLELQTIGLDVPVRLYGDRMRLSQVISNLLGNAEKFTPGGGRITVSLERTYPVANLRIADTGVGIDPRVLPMLFEPFAQMTQPIDRKLGGVGLGLAMVKALVELHGGRVAISSPGLGLGTEVRVAVPYLDAEPVKQPAPRLERTLPRRRVLIVEDKQDVAESLRFALSLKGHTVETAGDGAAAFRIAYVFQPEVVLCDLGLPDMDGYAVARRFRSDVALAGAYLVALSGYATANDIARAHAAGFERHIAKPPRLEELDLILAQAGRPSVRNELH